MNIGGGCLCGAVRFVGVAEPVFQVKCDCTDCRKTAGSGDAAVIGVPMGQCLQSRLFEMDKELIRR
jgi:hypothetical protein